MAKDSFPNANKGETPEWPDEVKDFEAFLTREGLLPERKIDKGVHGNKLLQCGNGSIAIQVIRDRGDCFLRIAESSRPNDWYPIALLRELLAAKKRSQTMTISDEISFVEHNWLSILGAFSEVHRHETHKRLYNLGRAMVRECFPGLIS